MAEPLKTIGALIASGVPAESIPPETWAATPLNRADLRQNYYRLLPRATRRKVFGRWRHKRVMFTHYIEQLNG